MPTLEARIAAIAKRIAARDAKLQNLPAIKKLRAGNEADEAEKAKLVAEDTKKRADQDRRDENHAKILIGAAVLLLPSAALKRTMNVLRTLLRARDQTFIDEWFAKKEVDITGPTMEESSVAERHATQVQASSLPPAAHLDVDPIGTILKSVVGEMDEAGFGLIGPEILGCTSGENRAVLENWYAELDEARQGSRSKSKSDQDYDNQRSQPEVQSNQT